MNKAPRKKNYEEITLEELSERYQIIHDNDRKAGYGARTAQNHFQIALLFLTVQEFKMSKDGNLFQIRPNSRFSKKSLGLK